MSEHRRTSIEECAAIVHRGGVILYPTEGVWGLGCDPRNQAAVERILEIKGRDVAKGLILLAGDDEHIEAWVDWLALDKLQRDEINATWPGHHTWIVPASAETPAWIRGDHDTIAMRISDYRLIGALCERVGSAIVSTSANPAGGVSPTTLSEVDRALIAAVDGICEGETQGKRTPSQIHDALSGAIVRD